MLDLQRLLRQNVLEKYPLTTTGFGMLIFIVPAATYLSPPPERIV